MLTEDIKWKSNRDNSNIMSEMRYQTKCEHKDMLKLSKIHVVVVDKDNQTIRH